MLTAASHARADWCHDESQLNGQILCDDFDRYCTNPPPPWQSCPTGGTRSDGALHNQWKYHSWNYNTSNECGTNMNVEDNQTLLNTPPYGGRHANGGDEGQHLGQNVVDLTPYVQGALPGYNTANGSDDQPLVLRFEMSGGLQTANKLPWSNGFMELALGDGNAYIPGYRDGGDHPQTHAPTDFVLVGGTGPGSPDCFSCYGLCRELGIQNSGVHVPWPTICQQEFPNPACPTPSTVVRPVIAIGALAELDNDPCHCDTPASQKPNNWHVSFFDGLRWRILKSGKFPGSGDFTVGDKNNTVILTIKTNTMEVWHRGRVGGNWIVSTATDIPREYLGGFNRLRAGTGVSCELEGAGNDYECQQAFIWGGGKCQRMGEFRCDGGGWQTNGSGFVSFDTMLLSGGIGNTYSPMGACCLSDASCQEISEADCQSAGGTFNGTSSTCAAATCCVDPFADADADGDVDQDDYGVMQACLTGPPPGNPAIPTDPAYCACMNRNPGVDSAIDQDDVNAFEACASGPTVPADPGCDD
jgi:hypothetical protein